MKKPKMTVILYDGGFKDSAPALMSLQHQTILPDIQVLWIEYKDKVFSKVRDFPFVRPIKLNRRGKTDNSYCYNTGLSMATGKLFVLVDPCLWMAPDTLENICGFHTKHPRYFTYNQEARGKNDRLRFELTDKYYPTMNKFKSDTHKIKKGNVGCLSCAPTEFFWGVGGFDMFNTVYTNHLKLCSIRMQNKYGLKLKMLDQQVYHPFHPRGKKGNKDEMRALVRRYKKEKVINPSLGGMNHIKGMRIDGA
jgi:hypothetical protein